MKAVFDFRRVCGSIAACLLVMALLSGCGSGGSGAGEAASNQGALSFRLAIASCSAAEDESEFPCEAKNIATIEVEVLENGSTVAIGEWACTEHKGTINDVPAGSDLELVAYARAGSLAVFSGRIEKLKVVAGETTNAGTINLCERIANRNPVLTVGEAEYDPETRILTIKVSAKDPDDDNLEFSAVWLNKPEYEEADLPENVTWTDYGDGTAQLQWEDCYYYYLYAQYCNSYDILFSVMDDAFTMADDGTLQPSFLSDSKSITIKAALVPE
jgi:hypothetical protein